MNTTTPKTITNTTAPATTPKRVRLQGETGTFEVTAKGYKPEPERALAVRTQSRELSDGSLVYSVVIRDTDGIAFVELDACSHDCAEDLRKAIVVAIRNFTNIPIERQSL